VQAVGHQDLLKLVMYEGKPLVQGAAPCGLGRLKAQFKVIEHWQEGLHEVGMGLAAQVVFFAYGPFAQVIEVCQQAQVSLFVLLDLGL
jgi:hypothetical protein